MPAVALGLDPASEYIMDRLPKNTSLNILHRRNIILIVPMVIYMAFSAFAVYVYVGSGTDLARTALFASIILMIMVNTFNFKSLEKNVTEINWWENKLLWLSLAGITPVLLAIIYNPTLAGIFGHEPLSTNHWIIAIGAALSTVVVIEILKKFPIPRSTRRTCGRADKGRRGFQQFLVLIICKLFAQGRFDLIAVLSAMHDAKHSQSESRETARKDNSFG